MVKTGCRYRKSQNTGELKLMVKSAIAGSLISTKRQEKSDEVRSMTNREWVKSGISVPRRMATDSKWDVARAQPSVHSSSVHPLTGITVWSNPLKSVVPQTVGKVLFGLKNDISAAKIVYFYTKQAFLD